MNIRSGEFPSHQRDFINATGGWTLYGAGLLCDEARAAIDAASRRSVVMAELQDEACEVIAGAFGVEAAVVVNCAAAALAVTAAAALVVKGDADPRQLPTAPPRCRKLLLPKGQALNFSAEVTQMLRFSGGEPVEMGAVNSCTAAVVDRACKDPEVAGAFYVQSAEAFPYGTLPLEQFVEICHSNDVLVIVDASAQPLTEPILRSGADAVIQSPHKMMGSPTAGLILGERSFVDVCRSMESSFARPFKTSKEALSGVAAAVTRWSKISGGVVERLWEDRARYAARKLAGIPGLKFAPFYYPPPLQGVHARLQIDEKIFGLSARSLADQLRSGSPRVAVVEEEVAQGALIIHFAMLDEDGIDKLSAAIRMLNEQAAGTDLH